MAKDLATREELEKRMDELARQYATTHNRKFKAEIEELSRRIGTLRVLADAPNRCRGKEMQTREVFERDENSRHSSKIN